MFCWTMYMIQCKQVQDKDNTLVDENVGHLPVFFVGRVSWDDDHAWHLKLKVAKLNKILAQVVQLDEEDGAVETDLWIFLS